MTSFIPAASMSGSGGTSDGDSTTHFRVGVSEAEVRGPEMDRLE